LTSAWDLQDDWSLAAAMVDALEDYLNHDMAFMPVLVPGPGGSLRRAVSLGGFLQLLTSLKDRADRLAPTQAQQLDQMERKAEELREQMSGRYWAKARQEIQSHLNSLEWFLDDVVKWERVDRVIPPGEIRHYQQMRLLLDHARAHGRTELEDLQERATALDEPLKTFLNQNKSSNRER
jgi:DNA-binding transcriptional MerR regulator